MNNKTTRIDMVLTYLRSKTSAKLTTEQLCQGVNQKYNTNFNTNDVSKTIAQLKNKNMIKCVDFAGLNSRGMKVTRWSYKKA